MIGHGASDSRRPAVSIEGVLEAAAAEWPRAPRPGQGARDVRPRRPPVDGRLGSHLRLRRRAADPDPGQGQGPHRAVGLLVRAHGRHRAQPPPVVRRARTRCAAARWSCRSSRSSRSNASSGATCRARAGRSTGRAARSAGSPCRPGCSESDRLPEPIFTPATKAERRRARRERRLRPRGRDRRRPRASWRSCAGCRSRSTRTRPSTPSATGIILADTKFEFGRGARAARSCSPTRC